jgi:fused signal recognition particle receptor
LFSSKIFTALKQTRGKISDAFDFVRKEKVSIESLDQLEETLILADIGIVTVEKTLEVLKKNKKNNFIQEVEHFLISVLPESKNDKDHFSRPMVILMVGVNGTGKTTSCAKLAKYYKTQDKKILMIAADTYRAAAVDQLKVWSNRLNVDIIYNQSSNQPSAVLFDGLTAAKNQKSDIIIVDTAGRLHTSKNLMFELEKMYRLAKKNFSSFNINSLITLDASIGQNSLIQAKDFNKIINLDGAILTKMDGTAKGGIVFPLYNESNIPVKFIGTGEDLDDLYEFNRREYIQSILGINKI